jgi:hypothetical protein
MINLIIFLYLIIEDSLNLEKLLFITIIQVKYYIFYIIKF